MALTDIICTNENEAEFITGLTLSTLDEFKDAAKKMLDMGPRLAIVREYIFGFGCNLVQSYR